MSETLKTPGPAIQALRASTSILSDSPVEQIESIAAFTSLVEQHMADTGPLWFRGVTNANGHRLLPSLYRGEDPERLAKSLATETELIESFRLRAPPFLPKSLPPRGQVGDLETLFIMQHYGVPTRLLDWTENPFVALYFALKAARQHESPTEDAAVWVLDPIRLNEISLSNTSRDKKRILAIDHPNLNGYAAGEVGASMPVAIFGVHNSQRIVAQRGVFVLFGADQTPMDKQPKLDGQAALRKFVISSRNIKNMHRILFNMGFADSVVFPDLDGLAREISFEHGF